MRLVEGRRLTGANLWIDGCGAAVEVRLDGGESHGQARARWLRRVKALCRAVGLDVRVAGRRHEGGATWVLHAPVDQLHVAVDIVETAVSGTLPDGDKTVANWSSIHRILRERARAEAHPPLRAMVAWAAAQQVPLLWDDEVVSLGCGNRSVAWPARELPTPAELSHRNWDTIPVALVTGTNGKTTTARWLTRMLRCAGVHTGSTSTDGWCVDEVPIETGDWTGPGAARKVLRDARVEAAVLETARGGLLRRGLAVDFADVAVVTNVSDDHLGEWGIDDVAAMAEAKLSIAKGLRKGGRLVANADCAPLAEAVGRLGWQSRCEVAWFSCSGAAPAWRTARDGGGEVAWAEGGALWWQRGGQRLRVAEIADIPLCFDGHAPHNCDNALAALLAARALGLDWTAIREGLGRFRPNAEDNPGRANVMTCRDATVVLDFAHNPDGIRQIARLAEALPARRRLIVLGQAGDRSDAAIAALADAAREVRADHFILKESLHYLRGRALGEVTSVLRNRLLACGISPHAIETCMDEAAAVEAALAWAEAGDLLILLIHDDFADALRRLRAAGAQSR